MKTLHRFLIIVVLSLLAAQLGFAQNVLLAQAQTTGNVPSPSALHRPRDLADDVYWDGRFAPQGVNGPVNAIAANGTDVYVGGNFTTAGGVVVNSIAKWDGNNWSALGTGILTSYSFPGTVYSIAISGNDVYVGGMFALAGGVPANNIAKWSGSTNSWSALSSGTDNSVYAMAANGTDVYVGGYFYSAGGVVVNSIAKWNGSTWSALGSGVSAPATIALTPSVHESLKPLRVLAPTPAPTAVTPPPPPGKGIVNAIAVNGNDVYIGGNFLSVSGVAVSGIAKWDGNVWSTLGSGVGGRYASVSAVAVSGNNVYVGGGFSNAGGITTSGIAKWDGSTNSWSSLGNGIGGGSNPLVKTIAIDGNDVFVGGGFSTAGSILASNVAKWDALVSNWSALGSGVDSSVYAIAASASGVYVGGYFAKAGGNAASDIALWNGSAWSPLAVINSNGIRGGIIVLGNVRAIAVSGNDVYVGGTFTTVGNISANNIAKWNGSNWSALGDGIPTPSGVKSTIVYAIAINGNDVYVGGVFSTAGGVPANNIAKWNGLTNSWSALGSGVDSGVLAIAINGTDVYAGGGFTVAGNISASRIAKWDGNAWSSLGTGLGGGYNYPIVYSIATNGMDVYAGGSFTAAGNVVANNIAKWNGSTNSWSGLGNGLPSLYGNVSAIALNGSQVYAAGYFSPIGNVGGNNIAKWDGTTWLPLGSGLDSTASAIVVRGNNVYVGGSFSNAGSVSANRIAQWNGCRWSALGSGVDATVAALASNPSDIYVGGDFSVAGNKPSNRLARWSKPDAPTGCVYYFPIVIH